MRPFGRAHLLVVVCCAALLGACGPLAQPTQTPFIVYVTSAPGESGGVSGGIKTPTPEAAASPTPSPAASATSTRAPTPSATRAAQLATYTSTRASFSIQYPADWDVSDQEQDNRLVVIQSPDKSSALLVAYGAAGTESAEQAMADFLQAFNMPDLKVSNQKKNSDGSMSADLAFSDPNTNSPVQGLLRVLRQATSPNFFALIFFTTPDQFADQRALGTTLLNSFQEKPSIVRQSTPPSVISAATPTRAAPPTSTPTEPPPPTDTPTAAPPPPTNTPRPPPAAYRMDVRVHEGYERWGTPVNNCQDFDNNRPEKKLTMDVTVYNDTARVVSPNDIDVTYLDGAGKELVYCVYADQSGGVPDVPAHGSATYVLAAFVDLNGWVSQMRLTIATTTLRRCFAPNNRADLVGCN